MPRSRPRTIGILAAVAGLALGCGGAARSGTAPPAGPPAVPPPPVAAEPPRAVLSAAEVRDWIMGEVVVGDLDGLLDGVRQALGPAVPLPPRAALEQQLLGALGTDPHLAAALDLSRPVVIIIVDPTKVSASEPFIVGLPVRSFPQLVEVLGGLLHGSRRTARGNVAVGRAGEQVAYVARVNSYAVLAGNEDLLDPAPELLLPLVARPAPRVTVRVNVARIFDTYGPVIERMQAVLTRSSIMGGDWLRYLKSVREASLAVTIGRDGLIATGRIEGRPGGEVARLAAAQPVGPPWGVEYLPADTTLLLSRREAREEQPERLEEAIERLAAWLGPDAPSVATRRRLLDVARRGMQATAGDTVFGLWPEAGGIGAGGVGALADEAQARLAWRAAGPLLKDLVRLADRRLKREGSPVRFGLRVRYGAFRAAGASADEVQLTVGLPRKEVELKRTLAQLFGPRLVLAVAIADGRASFAVGKGYRARLAALVAAGRGAKKPNVTTAPGFAEAAAFHPHRRAALFWMRVLDTLRTVLAPVVLAAEPKAGARALLQATAATSGRGALMVSMNVDRDAFVGHLKLEQSAIAELVNVISRVPALLLKESQPVEVPRRPARRR